MIDDKRIYSKETIVKHLISISLGACILIGMICGLMIVRQIQISRILVAGIVCGLMLIYPFMLTLLNLFFLCSDMTNKQLIRKGRHIEYITVFLGIVYTVLLASISDIQFTDWHIQLSNAQVHTPIWTEGMATIVVLSIVGVCGYLFLSFKHITKVPPLISVCAIAAIYLGMAMCIIWIVQLFRMQYDVIFLCLLPFNCVVLGCKTVRRIIFEWNMEQSDNEKELGNQYLNRLNRRLQKAEYWPIAAFLLMWPLLGIIIGILLLFGQRPDAVIRSWTETSDWNLSTKESPPNVIYDEHYLCTVAAGGHRRIVKPIRMGQRHGHVVVVNRQLCIANAFEQILEERTPVFHRKVRHAYDTYGFPIARLIRSPYAADMVYFLMKPLEWLFLLVLYCCDVNPENRIAVQYLPKQKERKLKI